MAQPQKETILGNYTSFPRFPLDCESMDYIQNNTKLLAVIAQIAGCDKLIIKGCTGSPRTEGYVYVRTGDDLVGEILYYGGGTGVRCSIATDNIDTTANGETFANAYTKRMLVSGTTGTWAWSDFKALSEITNAALKAAVDGKAASNHNHDTAYAAKNHNHDTAYASKSHTHAISEVSGLQTALNGKAAATHTHTIANVSGLQDALNGKANNIRLSSYASDDGKITALRWGNVVTLHINGVQTYSQSSQVYTDKDVVQLPKQFQPTIGETVYGVGFRGYATGFESSGITLCIKNANLDNPNNIVIIQWYRTSGFNNAGYIYATLTYITQNPDS